mmetsp:Transcript_46049/g.38785  ORF Transcript_46049/g.38785 Transcript_46049/m.38785 type:complete len:93 (+) Transcript_46049:443-721(+)
MRKQPNKRLDEPLVSRTMAQVLKAFYYMHSKRILHRDIKPENILVFHDDPIHIKLTDFGWGAYAGDGDRLTRCGTLDYMCPETVAEKKRPHS